MMPRRCLVPALLSCACASAPAPSASKSPTHQSVCVGDVVAHATEDAVRTGADEGELGSPIVGPLGDEAAPLDLDGDGRPEVTVSFEGLVGAYSRRRWVYADAEGCARFLGAFEEAYLWPGTQRHAGLQDILVLQVSGDGEAVADGGGTMTRLVFDGQRYVPDGSLECPVLERGAPRDARCPGAWGGRGAWVETEAWSDGASPRSVDACVSPAADARVAFEGADLTSVELADIDGDGQADLAFGSEAFSGSAGHELEVYVTHGGCPRSVGRISALGEPSWDAERGELMGGWTEATAGTCEPGDVAAVYVYYRLEDSGLVESRRVTCACGEPEGRCP